MPNQRRKEVSKGPLIASRQVERLNVQLGTNFERVETDQSGYQSLKTTEVSEENIQQLQRQQSRLMRQQVAMGFLYSGLYFVFLSCVSIPILWFVFRMERMGVVYTVLYSMTLSISMAVAFIAVSGSSGMYDQFLWFLIIATAVSTAFIAVPLYVSKSKGFVLVNRKESKEHASGNENQGKGNPNQDL